MDVLISPSELADRLTDFRLLDVRWTVMAPDGRAAYLAGHLPGAVFVDLDVDLADHSVTGRGRHPLPTPQALAASARRWGLNDGDAVVVYDDWNGQAAARAWWLLRAAGVSNVRILDGGWAAWQRSGGPVATGRWPRGGRHHHHLVARSCRRRRRCRCRSSPITRQSGVRRTHRGPLSR